jgi:hypothetical protein
VKRNKILNKKQYPEYLYSIPCQFGEKKNGERFEVRVETGFFGESQVWRKKKIN